MVRADAIGAATVGWAANQASATAATGTRCPAAISSSTARVSQPAIVGVGPRALGAHALHVGPGRYLPVRKPLASP